ncbi:MAG: Ig-like domain-containing protein, partial [Oscillospiraceae bacterium]|nr:Ig-like domain-containing protein [Oscillospiraceae bacterium]
PVLEENQEIIWTSYNPEVATVDANGNVVALAEGYAYLTAVNKYNSTVMDYCLVRVTTAKMGDVNGDGRVNTRDVITALQAIAAKTTDSLTAQQKSAADVNCDGRITTRDLIIILQAIAAKTTDQL